MTTLTQDQKSLEREKILALVDEFSRDQDVIDFVKKVEARSDTTRGHYADYMGFLCAFQSNRTQMLIMAAALVKAGADSQGVSDATGIITGRGL